MATRQSRCGAWTEKGTRCRNRAMVGASRCHLHRGAWSSYTIDKRKARANRRRRT
ncbi:HGGxSTG domain-containing protein [Streptomyces chumphonensis]|uniref:HGGxSTG domain-containing protein n=1 Tax=Streptomyces chumphonensis TaxID=1214925 RepID=UPI003D75FD97